MATGTRRKVYRSRSDKVLGGVCGGLADYFNVSKSRVSLFRGERSHKKVFEIDADRNGVISSIDPAIADNFTTYFKEV